MLQHGICAGRARAHGCLRPASGSSPWRCKCEVQSKVSSQSKMVTVGSASPHRAGAAIPARRDLTLPPSPTCPNRLRRAGPELGPCRARARLEQRPRDPLATRGQSCAERKRRASRVLGKSQALWRAPGGGLSAAWALRRVRPRARRTPGGPFPPISLLSEHLWSRSGHMGGLSCAEMLVVGVTIETDPF